MFDGLSKESDDKIAFESELVSPSKENKRSILSEFTDEYIEFMKEHLPSQEEIDSIIKTMLKEERIKYNKNHFKHDIKYKIVGNSPNFRVVKFEVVLGYFTFPILVFMEEQQSYAHYFPSKQSSRESRIFFATSSCGKITVKCFPLDHQVQTASVFCKALKQYCFLKIAELLGAGPKLKKNLGFDIVFFQDCIEFSMERCVQIRDVFSRINEKDIESLKAKLNLLHYFRLVHMDIKPENIMFSKTYEKLVFIDFGFSRVVNQEKGFKTKTQFHGSIRYCSSEMLYAYSSKEKQLFSIDLYYNDIHCLKITLQEIQNLMIKGGQQQVNSESFTDLNFMCFFDDLMWNFNEKAMKFSEQQNIMKIKYLIYCRKRNILNNQHSKEVLLTYNRNFMEFILQFPYYQSLYQIYTYIIKKTSHRDSVQMYAKIMEFKKQKLLRPPLSYLQKHESKVDKNLFYKKIDVSFESEEITYYIFSQQISLIFQQNMAMKLLDDQYIDNIHPTQYYPQLIKVIDFRACQSTLEEKMMICQKCIEKNKINDICYPQVVKFKDVQLCYRHIISYYIENCLDEFEEVIPNTLTNMIILEAFSASELLEIMHKIVGLNLSDLTKTLTLFKIFLTKSWIQIKVLSIYSHKFLYELGCFVIKALKQIIEKSRFVLAQICSSIVASSYGFLKIEEEQYLCFWEELSKNYELSEDSASSIWLFAVFARYRVILDSRPQQIINMISKIRQFGGQKLHFPNRINQIDLKILHYFRLNRNDSLSAKLYQNMKKCLQSNIIIEQLKINFCFINCQNDNKLENYILTQSDKIMKKLKKLLLVEGQAFFEWVSDFLHFNFRFFKLKSASKQTISSKMRDHFSSKYLHQIALQGKDQLYFSIYLENFALVTQIYFALYQKGEKELIELKKVFDMIKIPESLKKCRFCFQNLQNLKKKIDITFSLHENRYEDGIHICLQLLQYSLFQTSQLFYDSDIEIYLGKMIVLIDNLVGQKRKKYSRKAKSLIFENNLFGLIFNLDFGKQIYKFLFKYTLEERKKVEEYIYFQNNVFLFLRQSPSKQNISLAIQALLEGLVSNRTLFSENLSQLLTFAFQQYCKSQNPYLSLLFSFFVDNFSPQLQGRINKCILLLCKSVDNISPSARILVMRVLVNFQYHKAVQKNKEKCKRKMIMTFGNYLIFSKHLVYFIEQVSLNNVRKKRNKSYYFQKLYLKIKKFYLYIK